MINRIFSSRGRAPFHLSSRPAPQEGRFHRFVAPCIRQRSIFTAIDDRVAQFSLSSLSLLSDLPGNYIRPARGSPALSLHESVAQQEFHRESANYKFQFGVLPALGLSFLGNLEPLRSDDQTLSLRYLALGLMERVQKPVSDFIRYPDFPVHANQPVVRIAHFRLQDWDHLLRIATDGEVDVLKSHRQIEGSEQIVTTLNYRGRLRYTSGGKQRPLTIQALQRDPYSPTLGPHALAEGRFPGMPLAGFAERCGLPSTIQLEDVLTDIAAAIDEYT